MDLRTKYGVNIPLSKLDNPSIQMLIDFCIRENLIDNRLFMLLEEKLQRNEC